MSDKWFEASLRIEDSQNSIYTKVREGGWRKAVSSVFEKILPQLS